MNIRKFFLLLFVIFESINCFSQIGKRENHSLLVSIPVSGSQIKFITVSGNQSFVQKIFIRPGFCLEYRFEFLPRHYFEIGYFIQAHGAKYTFDFNQIVPEEHLSIMEMETKYQTFSIPYKYTYELYRGQHFKHYAKVGYVLLVPYLTSQVYGALGTPTISLYETNHRLKRSHIMHVEYGIERTLKNESRSIYFGVFAGFGFKYNTISSFQISHNQVEKGRILIQDNGSFVGFHVAYIFRNSSKNED